MQPLEVVVMPHVSVVVAAYNIENLLERCVQSLLASRGVTVEILIVENGSRDKTYQKAQELAAQHAEIVVCHTETNSGPATARNIGFARASGDWIAVVDGDDVVDPDHLSTLVAHAQQKGLDVCFDNLTMVQDGKFLSTLVPDAQAPLLEAAWTPDFFARMNQPYESPVLLGFLKPLFRKSFLTTHRLAYIDGLYNSEDYLLILECLLCGARVGYVHRALYHYYIYPKTLSGSFNEKAHAQLIEAEQAILSRYAARLDVASAQAIAAHIQALHLAAETNAIFAAWRQKKIGRVGALLLRRPCHTLTHIQRLVRSLLNKVTGRKSRGT